MALSLNIVKHGVHVCLRAVVRGAAPYNEWYFLFKGILIWLTLIFMRLVLSEAELRNEARLGPETGEVEESGK